MMMERFTRRYQASIALLGFIVLFTVFCLIIWGAARPFKAEATVKILSDAKKPGIIIELQKLVSDWTMEVIKRRKEEDRKVLVVSNGDQDRAALVDFRGNPVDDSRTGGWLATGLILGTELSERICVMGISMNMVTYLVGEMHLSSSKSANIVANFMGTLNILGLLGGFLAYAKRGRYLTVAIFASIAARLCSILRL